MNTETVQLYKVVKIMRVSNRRVILAKDLTREAAIRMVNSYPDSKRSMVVSYSQN